MHAVLRNMDNAELVETLSFFPHLLVVDNENIPLQYPKELKLEIKNKKIQISSLSNKELLTRLIDRFFDLNNYEELMELDALGWANQFFQRKKILDKLASLNTKTRFVDENEFMRNVESRIFNLLLKPVISGENLDLVFTPNESTINPLQVHELHALSQRYIDAGAFNLIDDMPDNEDNLTHTNEELENLFNLCTSFVEDSFSEGKYPSTVVVADLNAPDKVLLEDFKKHIIEKRKETKTRPLVKSQVSSHKFKSYIQYKLIPYIDLKILNAYCDQKKILTDAELADYLFPDTGAAIEIDAAESIRKTTRENADEMLTAERIKALCIAARKNIDID